MKRKKKNLPEIESEPVDALSYEEMKLLHAEREKSEDRSQLPPHDQSDKAKLVRFAKKNKLVTAAILIVVLSLLVGVVFGAYWLISLWVNRPNTSDFTIELGEEKPYTVPYDEMVRDGVLYVDLRKLAPFSDLIVSGSREQMQFTAKTGTFLSFENESEIARINGKRVEMIVPEFRGEKEISAKAFITAEACYVPYHFLKNTVSDGLQFRFNNETNTLSFRRTFTGEVDEEDQPIAATVLFFTNQYKILPEEGEVTYEYSYLIDIDPYLESITAENLLLANKQNPLGPDFKPVVVSLQCRDDGEGQKLQYDAERALYAMMLEMEAAGVPTDVFVTSSYRSYAYQKQLYEGYVQKHMTRDGMTREEAEAAASRYSARPGESEHQTGLCFDFTTESIQGKVDDIFEQTEAFTWLSQNAHKFGFILRYPKDKVAITQYDYEPWHYRFVGRAVATEIYEKDICLEEYLSGVGN